MLQKLKFWLLDFVPYSPESWTGLLRYVNDLYWPYSLVVVPVLLLILTFGQSENDLKRKGALWLLGLCWLWSGLVFIRLHFSTLNWVAAWLFWLFIVQAIFLVIASFSTNFARTRISRLGLLWRLVTVLISMIALPLLQLIAGHSFASLSWFALTPDNTALATLAILVYIQYDRWILLVIPVVWSALVFTSSWPLGLMPESMLLPLSIGFILLRLSLKNNSKRL